MKNITGAIENLEKSREILFEVSRDLMSSENGDFRRAEAFFELAKRAEILRMEAKELSNGKLELAPARAEVAKNTPATAKASTTVVRGPRKNKQDYPKYLIRNKNLVKIGLSRDSRTEYVHTVDEKNLDKILDALNTFIGVDFVAPDIFLKLTGIPEYQVYVVVARLKELGLLVTPRKGVYRFAEPSTGAINIRDLRLTDNE